MEIINTEGLKLIGQGVSGEVFELDDEKVVKIFRDRFTKEQVLRAYEVARFMKDAGILTAKAYETVQSGNRYGIVYEYLREPTLLKCIAEGVTDRMEAAKKMGRLLRAVHSLKVPDNIQTISQMVSGILERCGSYLDDEMRRRLVSLIERFPGTMVVHGDFHENNILVRGDEFLLIDLDSVCTGSALFDMEHLFCIYKTGIPKGLKLEVSEGMRFLDTLLRSYFDTDDEDYIKKMSEVFTKASFFSVFFSYILRTAPGAEEETKCRVREDYPRLVKTLEGLEEDFDKLPWRNPL